MAINDETKGDGMRMAFEKWAGDQGFPTQSTLDGKDYQDLRTQGAWESWQAAQSAMRVDAFAYFCTVGKASLTDEQRDALSYLYLAAIGGKV